MAATLIRDIVNQCIVELSQVPGVSTEVYSSDRLRQYVQDAFDLCWMEHKWEAYRSWWQGTINGSSGHLTADILPTTPTSGLGITNFNNIAIVWVRGSDVPIRDLPNRRNPFNYTGDVAVYKAADYTHANRPIKFFPITATNSVDMLVYQEPRKPFATTDYLYLDNMMLVYGACYLYSVDDAANPAQVSKFQAMFLKRMRQAIAYENDHILQLDDRDAIAWAGEDADAGTSGDGIGLTFTIGESAIG